MNTKNGYSKLTLTDNYLLGAGGGHVEDAFVRRAEASFAKGSTVLIVVGSNSNYLISIRGTNSGRAALVYVTGYGSGGQYGADRMTFRILYTSSSYAYYYNGSEDSVGSIYIKNNYTSDGSDKISVVSLGSNTKPTINTISTGVPSTATIIDNNLVSFSLKNHTHLYLSATSVSNLNTPTSHDADGARLVYNIYAREASNLPGVVDNANALITLFKSYHTTGYLYASQLAFPDNGRFYYRYAHGSKSNSKILWYGWNTISYISDLATRYTASEDRTSGYYKIAINSTARWMLGFNIKLYQGYKYYDIRVSGYSYSVLTAYAPNSTQSTPTKSLYWYQPKASLVVGDDNIDVYFGQDEMNKLWVAVPAGKYTGIEINNFTNGYTNVALTPGELFSITYITALSGTYISRTLTLPITPENFKDAFDNVLDDKINDENSDIPSKDYLEDTYLPLAGGEMTGSIITPQNDNMGIIPLTNNWGLIGSETNKFYRMYANIYYGDVFRSRATGDPNVATPVFSVKYNNSSHTIIANHNNGNLSITPPGGSLFLNYTNTTTAATYFGTSGNYYITNSGLFTGSSLYLQSLGTKDPLTNRTLAYGEVYSYNTRSINTSQLKRYQIPVAHTSVIGFGDKDSAGNPYGSIEIAGLWTLNGGLWFRSLRDMADMWWPWRLIFHSGINTYELNKDSVSTLASSAVSLVFYRSSLTYTSGMTTDITRTQLPSYRLITTAEGLFGILSNYDYTTSTTAVKSSYYDVINTRIVTLQSTKHWLTNIQGNLRIAAKYDSTTYSMIIGPQNKSFYHIYGENSIPFIFNNTVATTSGNLGTHEHRWALAFITTQINIASGSGVDRGVRVWNVDVDSASDTTDPVIGFIVGLSGTNRGVYDYTAGQWTIYRNSSNTVLIPLWASLGSTTKAVYMDANGHPLACKYSLSANVPNGAANRIAYYSAAGLITTNANIVVSGNAIKASGGFYEESDERLKDFYNDVEIDLDKLLLIPKKYFSWKKDPNHVEIGTSALEIQKLYPELVTSDDEGILNVSYSKLSIIALKAVDELYKEIKYLKSKLI